MESKLKAIFAALLLLQAAAYAQTQEVPEVVHLENSHLVFPGSREAQDAFYDKLDNLVQMGKGNVNIWQIGGSHIQASYFPNRIMENIDSRTIRGDRGFLFPRALAGTNRDRSYRMTTTGEWECPMLTKASKLEKPRYGVTGFGARTTDPTASVGFNIDPSGEGRWWFNSLRVLGYASSDKVEPYTVWYSDTLAFRKDIITDSYVVDLPYYTDSLTVGFSIPEGETFTLTGLEPMSGRPGVNYFASGVNGASVTSWIDGCVDLERDLQLVHPDLVIFGLGINDSACSKKDFKPEKYKDNYRRLIAMIKRVSPDCAFIFVTNNDSYRYVRRGMVYNENADAVRQAMTELAQEYGAGVWDLYGVMGGARTVLGWRDAGLIGSDKLHFTETGYTLLGDLFTEALWEDYDKSRQ